MAALVIAGGASAEVLLDYQFNDANGTEFRDAVFSGSATNTSFDGDGKDEWVTSNGSLRIVTTSGRAAGHDWGLASTISTGILRVEVEISGYDLTSGNTGLSNNPDFRFLVENASSTSAGPALRYNSAVTPNELYVRSQVAGAYNNSGDIGLDSSTALTMRMDFNLDTDEATTSYMFAGDADWTVVKTGTSSIVDGFNNITLQIDSEDIGATDYVDVDYFTVSTIIPEPATLGMIGMVAAGMIFIRRRFMI